MDRGLEAHPATGWMRVGAVQKASFRCFRGRVPAEFQDRDLGQFKRDEIRGVEI